MEKFDSKEMKCTIKQHSATGDFVALPKDLRNCFGNHQHCSASFCKKAGEDSSGIHVQSKLCAYKLSIFYHKIS